MTSGSDIEFRIDSQMRQLQIEAPSHAIWGNGKLYLIAAH